MSDSRGFPLPGGAIGDRRFRRGAGNPGKQGREGPVELLGDRFPAALDPVTDLGQVDVEGLQELQVAFLEQDIPRAHHLAVAAQQIDEQGIEQALGLVEEPPSHLRGTAHELEILVGKGDARGILDELTPIPHDP